MVTKPAAAAGDGAGFLIVDDLVDSGTTARVVRALLPKAHFACVYAKPAGRPTVDSFVTEVSQDTWILFPWDTEPQFIEPLARRGRCERPLEALARQTASSGATRDGLPGDPLQWIASPWSGPAVGVFQPDDVVLAQIGA